MDWLLGGPNTLKMSHASHDEGLPSIRRNLLEPESSKTDKGKSNNKSKMGGAMLSHLRALTSREGRKKGCGARMFVQACVLSGCDYAPSQLSGVGIVSAFKMIKENAHRDTKSRFLHTLKSFPKDKFLAPDDEDESHSLQRDDVASMVEKYEELLAKSESIFYYHRVLDLDGKVVPLVDTEKDGSADFLPCLARFEDESFIGDLDVNLVRSEAVVVKGGRTNTQSAHPRPSNPYRNICHNNPLNMGSRNPYALKRKTPTNLFSLYAHSEGAKSSTRKTSAASTSRFKSMSKDRSISREAIALDESSDDEIEEASPFSRSLPQVKTSDGRYATKSPQDDDSSSSSDDEIEEPSPFTRISPQSHLSNRNSVMPPQDESDDEIEEASPFDKSSQQANHNSVMPQQDESDDEIQEASSFDRSSQQVKPLDHACTPQDNVESSSTLSPIRNQELQDEVQVVPLKSKYFTKSSSVCETPASTDCNNTDERSNTHAVVTPPQSQQSGNVLFPSNNNSDDDDDDDCIIIEESSTTFKSPLQQAMTSLQPSRSNTKPPAAKTRWQGTRRKRTRFTAATKKDKGLGNSTKRTKSTSIRKFFQPVTNS